MRLGADCTEEYDDVDHSDEARMKLVREVAIGSTTTTATSLVLSEVFWKGKRILLASHWRPNSGTLLTTVGAPLRQAPAIVRM